MPIELHPQARQRFDELADELIPNISTAPPPRPPSTGFGDRLYIPDKATPLGDITEESLDLTGEKGFLVRSNSGASIGLYAAHYLALNNLAEIVQRNSALKAVLSVKFVREEIFKWLIERHRGTTHEPMTSALLRAADVAVVEHNIWIPVSYLYIPSPFEIGRIRFQTLDASLFETWLADAHAGIEQGRDQLIAWIEKRRKQFQASAAATIKLTAERDHAVETALDLADLAVGVLRLYADANYRSDETSLCALFGAAHLDEECIYLLNGKRLVLAIEGSSERDIPFWVIRDEDLADFRVMGLDRLSAIVGNEQRTPFQNDVLNALLLYTRGALKKDLADRLVYQFAGLESLLVVGSQESLVHKIGERMAFALESAAAKRLEIVRAVREAYDLRSGFVHHGRPVADRITFEKFARFGWMFFVRLSEKLFAFQTTGDFIKAIDQVKFS